MVFMTNPKQIDEIDQRVVVDPDPPHTTTKVDHRGPKPNVSDNGWLQQDNPPLRIMFNPNWTLAKAQIQEAINKLAKYINPENGIDPGRNDPEGPLLDVSLDPLPFQDYPDPETKDSSEIELENPNHEPAGQSNGGQFATGPDGSSQPDERFRPNALEPTDHVGNNHEAVWVSPSGDYYNSKNGIHNKAVKPLGKNPLEQKVIDHLLETGQDIPDTMGEDHTNFTGLKNDGWIRARAQKNNLYMDGNDPEAMKPIAKDHAGMYDRVTTDHVVNGKRGSFDGPLRDFLRQRDWSQPFISKSTAGSVVIKGERSITGYRNYWLLENGEVVKSIVALTDEEADEILNE